MPNLAPIINSAETIAAPFQTSLNAAFTELHEAFGFWPEVLTPYGGGRTKAECIHEGLSWEISDHYEAAVNRAAVDINNQRDFRNKDEALFLSILAKHGWHNMTTTGEPFPAEPWHFAKHGITTADNGNVQLDNTTTIRKGATDMAGVTFLKQTTLTKAGDRIQHTTIGAVADLGLRHPTNWQEFTCEYIDGGPGDTLSQYAKGLGGNPSIILSDADWATESKRLTTP